MKFKKQRVAINEDNLGDKAEQAIIDQAPMDEFSKEELKDAVEDDEAEAIVEGKIERVLDEMLVIALRRRAFNEGSKLDSFPNVVFDGPPGTAKTGRINSWAESRGINLITRLTSTLNQEDLDGIATVINTEDEKGKRFAKVGPTDWDQLDTPPEGYKYSVLFLDEWNRGKTGVRDAILRLINEHTIMDPRQNGMSRMLQAYTFTIAATNPEDDGDNGIRDALNDAELNRMRYEYVVPEKDVTRSYLHRKYARLSKNARNALQTDDQKAAMDLLIKLGKLGDNEQAIRDTSSAQFAGMAALANALLGSPEFHLFDPRDAAAGGHGKGKNGLITSPRSIEAAIAASGGTKQGLLDVWNNYNSDADLDSVEKALTNYKDIDFSKYSTVKDKANSVFGDEDPTIDLSAGAFKSSAYDDLMGILGN